MLLGKFGEASELLENAGKIQEALVIKAMELGSGYPIEEVL